MKYRKLMLSSLCLSVLAAVLYVCAPAICQTAGLVPMGNCSLPSGQYMITNMRTGQAVYAEIDNTGRLLAQDPRSLNFNVQPIGTGIGGGIGGGLGSQLLNQATGGFLNNNNNNNTGTTGDTGKGSMWGGLFRQGVQMMNNGGLNNNQAPLGQ